MDIIDDNAGADTLSEYEIKRLEQIKKNNEHLASLGIQSDIAYHKRANGELD